jgi:tetratricopeptide (TPR) repeat protein
VERRHTGYDRELILERAARARSRRQRRRAIALYRHALALDRNCVEIHERLAPLLAEAGQEFDAWNSYRAVAHAALRDGREDRAIAVFREATRALPLEIQAWQGLARLLLRQSENDAAIDVLLDGSRQFRTDWHRPQAIHLLRRARTIDPWHFDTVLELAQLLGRSDQQAEARLLLEELAERCDERRLRRVRLAQLQVTRGPRELLRWLSAYRRKRAIAAELPAGPPQRSSGSAPVLTLAPTGEVRDLDSARRRPVRVDEDTDADLVASSAVS